MNTVTDEPSAAGNRSVHVLEIWERYPEGLELSAANAGPVAGEHLLGRVDGPGLYFLLGKNAQGKSHVYAVLEKMQDRKLLLSESYIHDGATEARVTFGSARVDLHRRAGSDVAEVERSGMESLPPITSVPEPIASLVSGDHLQGEEARARARLRALLSYAPVPATDETARRLAEGLGEGPLAAPPSSSFAAAWTLLVERVKERAKRFREEPFRTGEDCCRWLLDQPREGLLEDHQSLVDLLNATANVAEKLAGEQAREVGAAEGARQATLDAALRDLEAVTGAAVEGRLVARASAPPPIEGAVGELRHRLGDLRAERRRQEAETARRQEITATHGARPSTVEEEATAEAARTRVEVARAQRIARAEDAARAEEATRSTTLRLDSCRFQVQTARQAARAAFEGLDDDRNFLRFARSEALAVLDRQAEAVTEALLRLREHALRQLEAEEATFQAVDQAEIALAAREVAKREELAAEDDLSRAETALGVAVNRAERWDATERLLAEPVPGPADGEIAAAERDLAAAEEDGVLWRHAQALLRDQAGLERERSLAAWLESVGEHLRGAIQRTWSNLGAIVTDSLSLPWLQVAGMKILLWYDGSGPAARLARTEADARDLRDLDDDSAISTAELHEACLSLMLTRREGLGGILLVPGHLLWPLDEARLGEFSARAAAAGLAVISERPRRTGDPEGLMLERVSQESASGDRDAPPSASPAVVVSITNGGGAGDAGGLFGGGGGGGGAPLRGGGLGGAA